MKPNVSGNFNHPGGYNSSSSSSNNSSGGGDTSSHQQSSNNSSRASDKDTSEKRTLITALSANSRIIHPDEDVSLVSVDCLVGVRLPGGC